MLSNVQITLIGTTHPGNIGAAARAMKTMNLHRLCLVQPTGAFPNAESTARAAGADDILTNANITDSLDDGLTDCTLIIGTSARSRRLPVEVITPQQCAKLAVQNTNNKVALLFGREHAGLTNEELNRCHYHVNIPSNPNFSSLNLAAAVQILCYEINKAYSNNIPNIKNETQDTLATDHEVQLFYSDLETMLQKIGFLKAGSPRKLMPRLKRLFNRIHLEKMEFDLLMGIIKAVNTNE